MNRVPATLTALAAAGLLIGCSATSGADPSPTPTFVEATSPQEGGPDEMPEIVASNECRDLTGILPVDVNDNSPNVASVALRYELLTTHSTEIAFADVQEGNVVVFGVAGANTRPEEVVTSALEELTAAGYTTETRWTVAEQLPWTFDDLCVAFDTARQELGAPGGVESVGFTADGRLRVGIAEGDAEPEAIASIEQRFPGMVEITVEVGTDVGASHRSNDVDGFSAGIAIQTYAAAAWRSCSASFAIQNSYGTFQLTAAHCSSANTQTVRNGTSQCWNGLSGNAFVGVTGSRFLNSTGDFAVIQTSPGIGGRMWVGQRCVGSGEVAVLGSVYSTGGAAVGFSGNNTGQATGTVISSTTECRDISYVGAVVGTYQICGLYSANPSPSSPIVQGGDSGGPVFGYTSGSGVYAAGVIVAVNRDTGQARYMSMPRILSVYSASVVVG